MKWNEVSGSLGYGSHLTSPLSTVVFDFDGYSLALLVEKQEKYRKGE